MNTIVQICDRVRKDPRELPPKAVSALEFYTDCNNPVTFGNKCQSLIAAGYTQSATLSKRAVTVFASEAMQRAISEYEKQKNKRDVVTKERLQVKAQELYNDAHEAGQFSVCSQMLTFMAKTEGLLTEKSEIKIEAPRIDLPDSERDQLAEIARKFVESRTAEE